MYTSYLNLNCSYPFAVSDLVQNSCRKSNCADSDKCCLYGVKSEMSFCLLGKKVFFAVFLCGKVNFFEKERE